MQRREHTPATQSIANPFLNFEGEQQGGYSRGMRRALNASARSNGRKAARSFGLVRPIRMVRPPPPPIRVFRRSLPGRAAPDGEDAPC